MEKTALELAQLLGGTVSGNPDAAVCGLGKIESAGPGEITFLANSKYEKHIYDCGADIAVVGNDFEPGGELPEGMTLIKVKDPYGAFATLLQAFEQVNKRQAGIHASAVIHETATVGEGCYVGAGVVIEEGAEVGKGAELRASCYVGRNAKVGERTMLDVGTRILDRCVVGDDCIIQSNTVVGSEGFGFAPKEDGSYSKVPQTGNVVIGNKCDIGAGCTIDRATLGSTEIHDGCKIDNLIQIAHNVVIGEKTVIAAQTGIAGSTIIGKNCLIGGQVGFVGHLNIADGTKIAAKAGISRNIIKPDTTIQGIPAVAIKQYQKTQIALRGLVRQFYDSKDSDKQ
ncbi:MAG: UDP-3-O-(3-hydroxymyristoyl)glucosamine N-acyltransferase [Crocinitomicaceae bacterium]|nr:UDP-3-O-(3-hydroxymyristoyl)glucosamine N-acyltransferase [Crocinitomicaceae bacterium]